MAQDPQSQFAQIYTLGVEAGIKRDGTQFESREYTDGVWCRFQRGVPKKMGGYQQLFATFNGIPRGMTMNAYNGVNYIFSGNKNGLDIFVTGQTIGVGSGPYKGQMEAGYSEFAISSYTANSFIISSTTDISGSFLVDGKIVFEQSTDPTTFTISSSNYNSTSNTLAVSFYPPTSDVLTNVWSADYYFQPDPRLLWQFDFQYQPLGGALNVIMHPGLNLDNIDNGIESQVYIGKTTPDNTDQWVFTGLADTAGNNPTYRPITVDGGVCVLHPFIFVYGSNGYIANNHVSSVYADQNLSDWNGPLANQVNMAAEKL